MSLLSNRYWLIFALALLCAKAGAETVDIHEARIGVMTGSTHESFVREHYPDAKIFNYSNDQDNLAALLAGKTDLMVTSNIFAMNAAKTNTNINPGLDTYLIADEVCAAVKIGDTALLEGINAALSNLKGDGIIADMEKRWLSTVHTDYRMPENFDSNGNGSGDALRIGINARREPVSFIDSNGNITGFSAELAYRIGGILGRKVELVDLEFASLIAALQGGKIEAIVDYMSVTPERKKMVAFSQPFLTGGSVAMRLESTDITGLPSANDFSAYKDAVFGTVQGMIFEQMILDRFPNANILLFITYSDVFQALRSHKIDAAVLDRTGLKPLLANAPNEFKIISGFNSIDYGVVCPKGSPLPAEFDAFQKEIGAKGIFDEMKARWNEPNPQLPEIALPKTGTPLKFATAGVVEPFSYITEGGKATGFDIEYAMRFAVFLNRPLDTIVINDFSGMLAAVQGGKADFGMNNVSITPERRQAFDFPSINYFVDDVALIVRADEAPVVEPVETTIKPQDFFGKRIAVLNGSVHDQFAEANLPGAEVRYYNDTPAMGEAVKNGRADALLTDDPLARKLVALNPELMLVEPALVDDPYGIMVNKEKSHLLEQLNEFYTMVKADGSYEPMLNRWLNGAETPSLPDISLTGENGTIKVATDGTSDPFSLLGSDGKPTGFSIEYIMRFAEWAGYKLEWTVLEFGALVTTVASGKVDIAVSSISITEERKKQVNFTEPYYAGGAVLVCLAPKGEGSASSANSPPIAGGAGGGVSKPGFFAKLSNSFYSNLIFENRWKLIVNGLGVTMLISLCALVLGTILGFGVCGLNMSRHKALNAIGKVYITILRGTPVLVLLMITFYIIFAKSSISGVVVAIIAFSLNEAAFIGEIIRGAISQVDKGQIEAARSLGYNNSGAFFLVTLPQAARNALPVYKNEFIGLVKSTSVVGYIAIQDLTRAGDIIRSRTFDAFFPLLAVAVMYLITTGLCIWLFDVIDKGITNKRLKQEVAV
ncbi:MAG: ABC transporter permease subunit [Spirochaetaceae bacterium]|jgi:polar amino acid transport system substrate-binding protein|nr:ABC transporter permease subunit [Spirochaetaceae bacterium]